LICGKGGVHTFDALREMAAYLPNTPISALIRSDALNGMNTQAKDVVSEFISCSAEAGVDVFTNFDAHNDWRNHVNVAEAVIKNGRHFQAALSWPVYNPDPTIFNVQWAVDFFREMVAMGAHSLYVKDPSGVLTPEMAGLLASEIKSAYPDLPLVFHTHYQTGYGYMTYLKAVENGANGIECSLGFVDGAGQPYGLTMLRTLEDLGFKTGNPNKAAMQKIADYCKTIQPLCEQGRIVRTPDIRVEQSGIAGGQRTILDKELKNAHQEHLIPEIDIEVQKTREKGGMVCQVTPAADRYVREAMRILRGGNPNKDFVPGYRAILTGEGGMTPEPVDPILQKQALKERALDKAQALLSNGNIDRDTYELLLDADANLIETTGEAAKIIYGPIVNGYRLEQVIARIDQLNRISENPEQLKSLNKKIKAGNRFWQLLALGGIR